MGFVSILASDDDVSVHACVQVKQQKVKNDVIQDVVDRIVGTFNEQEKSLAEESGKVKECQMKVDALLADLNTILSGEITSDTEIKSDEDIEAMDKEVMEGFEDKYGALASCRAVQTNCPQSSCIAAEVNETIDGLCM